MITTEQIPPGWHRDMSEDEVRKNLINYVKEGTHQVFTIHFLEGMGDGAVEILVDAACDPDEAVRDRRKFVRLIQRIGGSPSQKQMMRLNVEPACQDPIVKSAVTGLLKEHEYQRSGAELFMDFFAKDSERKLKSQKKRK